MDRKHHGIVWVHLSACWFFSVYTKAFFLGRHWGDCERFDSQKIWSHMHFAVQATRQKLERTHVPPAKTHLDTRQGDALWIHVENRGKMPEGWRNITLSKLTSPTWGQGKSSAICSFSKVSIHSPTWKFQKKNGNSIHYKTVHPRFGRVFFPPTDGPVFLMKDSNQKIETSQLMSYKHIPIGSM